jgi:hypothetical protein
MVKFPRRGHQIITRQRKNGNTKELRQRPVKGITINDIEVSFMKDDMLPLFVRSNVQSAEFNRAKPSERRTGHCSS